MNWGWASVSDLLTIEQAADLLQVSSGTIRSLLPRLGAVDLNQGSKARRLIRIPRNNVDLFLRGSAIPEAERKSKARPGPVAAFHFERSRA